MMRKKMKKNLMILEDKLEEIKPSICLENNSENLNPCCLSIARTTPNKIRFNIARYFIDEQCYRCFNLTDYPLTVGNAWGQFLLEKFDHHIACHKEHHICDFFLERFLLQSQLSFSYLILNSIFGLRLLG